MAKQKRAMCVANNSFNFNDIPNSYLTEKGILYACIHYLTLRGYEVIRNNSGALPVENNGRKRLVRFGFIGSSDILACSPEGRFVAVECKRPGGKLTNLQKNFLERISKKNGIAIVAHSVDDLIKHGI